MELVHHRGSEAHQFMSMPPIAGHLARPETGSRSEGSGRSGADRGCAGHPASRSSAFVLSSRGSPPHLPPKARGDIPGVLSRTTAHSQWLLYPPERVRKVMRKTSAPHPSHVPTVVRRSRQWWDQTLPLAGSEYGNHNL